MLVDVTLLRTIPRAHQERIHAVGSWPIAHLGMYRGHQVGVFAAGWLGWRWRPMRHKLLLQSRSLAGFEEIRMQPRGVRVKDHGSTMLTGPEATGHGYLG